MSNDQKNTARSSCLANRSDLKIGSSDPSNYNPGTTVHVGSGVTMATNTLTGNVVSVIANSNYQENHVLIERKAGALSELSLDFHKVLMESISGARKVANCLYNLASILNENKFILTPFKERFDDLDLGVYGDEEIIKSDLESFITLKFNIVKYYPESLLIH